MKSLRKVKSIQHLLITASIFFIAFSLNAQDNWSAGIKLGDPSGVSLKKYMGNKAIELNVGRTHWWDGNGWYNNRFNNWYKDGKFGYDDYEYLGYKANVPLSVQVHYLINNDITEFEDDLPGNLDWYYGAGVQMRYRSYLYNYRYKDAGDPSWKYTDTGWEVDLDLGIDAVIGLEYRFEDLPIALFIDANLFTEVLNDPFLFDMQGGLGARYLIK